MGEEEVVAVHSLHLLDRGRGHQLGLRGALAMERKGKDTVNHPSRLDQAQ